MSERKALDIDDLIDRFVETINRLPREPGSEDDIPPSVRGVPDDPDSTCGWYDWHILPWPDIGWIAPVEASLECRLPPSWRSLVTRYVFPRFEVGPLWVNANTPEGADAEFRERVFQDSQFVEVLLPQGFIPFANPAQTIDYDPICFDTRRARSDGECPLMRIEHESVLMNGRIGDKEEVAASFATLVEECVRTHAT